MSVGGGAASAYDPLDTAQFTVDVIRAAVEAAEDWNTYVMVHACSDRSVLRGLEAGVMNIDHGTMIKDASTMVAMRNAGAIYNPQAVAFSPTPESLEVLPSSMVAKIQPLVEGLDLSMRLARDNGVKIAFGTDVFGTSDTLARQNEEFALRKQWFTFHEILVQATSTTAELVAMSGPRNPYQEGPLGVIELGAYADLLLVEGNPVEDAELLVDYENNIDLIMKDGVI